MKRDAYFRLSNTILSLKMDNLDVLFNFLRKKHFLMPKSYNTT